MAMVRVEATREDIYPVVEAVGMWESRRDFQRVWEGWEAGIMAFHAFQPFEEVISDMFELIGRLQRGSMHEAAEKIEGIVRRIWNVHSS
jgi:hypothetical protein